MSKIAIRFKGEKHNAVVLRNMTASVAMLMSEAIVQPTQCRMIANNTAKGIWNK